MKKTLSILFAFFYLVLSTGIIFNMHYCHGELEEVSLGMEETFCCCASDNEEANCCKNEQLFFHLGTDEQLAQSFSVNFDLYKYIDIEKPVDHSCTSCASEKIRYSYTDLSPPPKMAIWKTNCSFLFYG